MDTEIISFADNTHLIPCKLSDFGIKERMINKLKKESEFHNDTTIIIEFVSADLASTLKEGEVTPALRTYDIRDFNSIILCRDVLRNYILHQLIPVLADIVIEYLVPERNTNISRDNLFYDRDFSLFFDDRMLNYIFC
jgi:hypothetical protein